MLLKDDEHVIEISIRAMLTSRWNAYNSISTVIKSDTMLCECVMQSDLGKFY